MVPATDDIALTLDPHPGSTKGDVGGVIAMRQGLSMATELTVELFCTRFSRGGQESSNSVVWQELARFAALNG